MNISPSNIFRTILPRKRFVQNCQAVLAAVSINMLTYTKCQIRRPITTLPENDTKLSSLNQSLDYHMFYVKA